MIGFDFIDWFCSALVLPMAAQLQQKRRPAAFHQQSAARKEH